MGKKNKNSNFGKQCVPWGALNLISMIECVCRYLCIWEGVGGN